MSSKPVISEIIHVGWLGPYGLIPGGLDVDPVDHWEPVYVIRWHKPDSGMTARDR